MKSQETAHKVKIKMWQAGELGEDLICLRKSAKIPCCYGFDANGFVFTQVYIIYIIGSVMRLEMTMKPHCIASSSDTMYLL